MATEYLDKAYTAGLTTLRFELVRRADSPTPFRYDWADGTFKVSGWTTRFKVVTEDSLTPGWYRDVVDPAAWSDGEYLWIIDDSASATGPIDMVAFSVVAGQFARLGAGVARAVWHHNIVAVDEDDWAGLKAATKLMHVIRRWITGYVQTTTGPGTASFTIKKNNGADDLVSGSLTDDGTTQTISVP